jgi:uncharacterized membrane protein
MLTAGHIGGAAMDWSFEQIVESVGRGVEAAGVAAIVLGLIVATVMYLARLRQRPPFQGAFRLYRQALGRALLLGLEILVAADIIRTIATSPTFRTVGVLAAIVLIRTFLSFSLELEIEGRWPWQKREPETASAAPTTHELPNTTGERTSNGSRQPVARA